MLFIIIGFITGIIIFFNQDILTYFRSTELKVGQVWTDRGQIKHHNKQNKQKAPWEETDDWDIYQDRLVLRVEAGFVEYMPVRYLYQYDGQKH